MILVAALYIGNLYFGWTNALTTQKPQVNAVAVKTGPVVIFTADKYLGATLSSADLNIIQVPVELIPADAVTSADAAAGKFIKADVAQGEMVVKRMLADPTMKNHDISYILADDHVLFAFPASDVMSSEGIIQRGDVIDLFATISATVKQPVAAPNAAAPIDQATPVPAARTFTLDTFQKVNVTALVANIIPNDPKNPAAGVKQGAIRTYLLALPPQDALVLKYLVDNGTKFDIVLRSPTSTKPFTLTDVTSDYIVELYGLQVLP
jgi:pilus assembly protein CpaB